MSSEGNGSAANEPETVVRRKSSMRKRRSEDADYAPRRPTQQRSIQRFESILQAAEDLLQTSNIEDISFYDIAAKAGISPASVNYFFPTMSSLCIELSRRYLRVSSQDNFDKQQALAQERNPSWQSWFHEMGFTLRDHYNSHRHVSEVVLGPTLNRESRRAAIEENEFVAQNLIETLKTIFVFPEIPELQTKFCYAIEISDSIMSRSYMKLGFIDEEATQEMVRMQVTYLRNFLPETLPLAPSPIADPNLD